MMKRILSAALTLLLLLSLMPALAESYTPPELYRIVLREETGDVTLGSAALFGTKTTLLTASACWAEGEIIAIGQDGEIPVTGCREVPDSQLILLYLAQESAAEPLAVTQAKYLLDYTLYGVNAQGEFISMELHNSRYTVIDNRAEALLYAAEGMLPGAIMLGDDFGLACLTLWQEGEGEGVYASVDNVTLEGLATEDLTADAYLLRNITAYYEKGQVFVDFAGADGYSGDAMTYSVYCNATNNVYYTGFEAIAGETVVTFPAVPFTEVMLWVVARRGGTEEMLFPQTAEDAVFVDVPAPQTIELYGLRNIRMGLTTGAPGLDGMPSDFLPQEPLTRENLTDPERSIYFMTEDTYTCAAEDGDHNLMVILYTAEGYTFHYDSGYVFMPEYGASDLWIADISDVFADYERFCDEEPWPAGTYTVLYTIDGAEVNRLSFTLD